MALHRKRQDQSPVSANDPGTESKVPAGTYKDPQTNESVDDNVLRSAEEQMGRDLTKLQTQ